MANNWYPIIDYSLCNECMVCVNHCTHGVYDKSKSIPAVVYPEGCVDGCRGCQKKCAQGAISYFGDTGASTGTGCGCSCS